MRKTKIVCTMHQLSLSWGVTPCLSEIYKSTDVLFYEAAKTAKKVFNLKKGDTIVITGGATSGVSGATDTIKVETL